MQTTLDGQSIFDEQGLTVSPGSWQRGAIERAVPGLDGTVSIDLGARSRQIRQTGVLRARSRAAMQVRIEAISTFLDGRTHTLRTAAGQVYGHVRVDTFDRIAEQAAGPGVVVEYKIAYTQLGE